jgi:uncharacterized membrane protein YeaQ/YmgE (transglycosylase-associated protein family)
MMFLVGALYGGVLVANLLKWYWWRFNGYGYFWGMVTGIGAALLAQTFVGKLPAPYNNMLYLFPAVFGFSLIGAIVGTLMTKPEDDEVLKKFYQQVNPWGFWGPIREQVARENPGFIPNPNFQRDAFNVAVGIVWQLSLVVLPIYLVLRNWPVAGGVFAVFLVTSTIMKFNWYDKLEQDEPAKA